MRRRASFLSKSFSASGSACDRILDRSHVHHLKQILGSERDNTIARGTPSLYWLILSPKTEQRGGLLACSAYPC